MPEDIKDQNTESQTAPENTPKRDVSFPGERKKKKPRNKLLLIVPIVLVIIGAAGWYIFSEPTIEEEITPTPTPYSENETPTPTQEPIARNEVKIQILNGTGISGAAGDLEEELNNLGYSEIEVGNASSKNYETTEVTFNEKFPQSVRDEIVSKLEELYDDVDVGKDAAGEYDVEIITGYPTGHTATPTEATSTSTPTPTEVDTTPTDSPTPTP